MSTATIKILYNNCYGSFDVSDEFEKEYQLRTGRPINRDSVEFWNTGPDSIRCDPVAVAIFEEFGSERSSGPTSAIEIHTIPAVFARHWDIKESDGDETVTVNTTEAYADILHGFMDSGDLGVLVNQYRKIKAVDQQMRRAHVELELPAGVVKSGDSEFIQSMKAGEWRAEDLTAIFRAMAGGVKDTGLVDDEDGTDCIGHT
jgi:hypothetical protein